LPESFFPRIIEKNSEYRAAPMQPAIRLMLKIAAIITLLGVALSISLGNIPHNVHAAPLSSPPVFSISATCGDSGNASFIITNSGGDMTVAYSYKVFEESTQVKAGSFQLPSGSAATVTTSGTFGNIRIDILDDTSTLIDSETTTCVPPTLIPTNTNTPTLVIIPPKLTIAANCDTGGNATFIITNSGGDMPAAYSYKVFEESAQVKAGSFQLTSGASASVTTSGTFGNIRMEITDDKGSVIASQGTTCDHPTSTPTSTNTYTAVPTHAPTSTPKPNSSGNNSVTSNNHYFWSGWLYTATRTPTITITTTGTTTTTRTSTVTSTTNSIAEAASSTPVAFTVTPIQSVSTPVAGTPMDGRMFLPWLGLGLILMGSFFSVIFFRQVQK
jgi:hypothetical protein